jgi:Outer membrane protein beta-barrel domain
MMRTFKLGRLAALVLVAIAGLTATNARATTWFVGPIAGVNFATISEPSQAGYRTCFTGGAFLEAEFTSLLGVRLEGLYTQKGARRDVNPQFGEQNGTLRLNYIEFPLMAVFTLNQGPANMFSLYGGPVFGFNTKAEVESDETGETTDLSDYVESNEFSAVIGAEFEHARTSVNFLFDVRYTIGATDISNAASGIADTVKNRGLALMAGFKFPLGGSSKK